MWDSTSGKICIFFPRHICLCIYIWPEGCKNLAYSSHYYPKQMLPVLIALWDKNFFKKYVEVLGALPYFYFHSKTKYRTLLTASFCKPIDYHWKQQWCNIYRYQKFSENIFASLCKILLLFQMVEMRGMTFKVNLHLSFRITYQLAVVEHTKTSEKFWFKIKQKL